LPKLERELEGVLKLLINGVCPKMQGRQEQAA